MLYSVRINGAVALQTSLQTDAYFAAAEFAEHSRAGYGRAAGASVSVVDASGALIAESFNAPKEKAKVSRAPSDTSGAHKARGTKEMARAAFILGFSAIVIYQLATFATVMGL
jgi:hypothetical protein